MESFSRYSFRSSMILWRARIRWWSLCFEEWYASTILVRSLAFSIFFSSGWIVLRLLSSTSSMRMSWVRICSEGMSCRWGPSAAV